MPVAIETPPQSGRNSPKPLPAKIWTLKEPPFEGVKLIDYEGYKRSTPETAIVIDNGTF
jgi:actin-related protein 5